MERRGGDSTSSTRRYLLRTSSHIAPTPTHVLHVMFVWLRHILSVGISGNDEEEEEEVETSHTPQVEIDSGAGVRLLATSIDGCMVYEVVFDGGGDPLSQRVATSTLQTDNGDVAARFFLGTIRNALVTTDCSDTITLRAGIVGTSLFGVGVVTASVEEITNETIDQEPNHLVEEVKALLTKHITMTTSCVTHYRHKRYKRPRIEGDGDNDDDNDERARKIPRVPDEVTSDTNDGAIVSLLHGVA